MFRVENNVPDVYVTESRDFQLFSRLYDLVFQSSRFSIDSLEQTSDTMRCNDTLLPLLATKVGFFTDLNLTSRADRQILSAFPYIIRYKGSEKGVTLVANVFERIMNTKVYVELDSHDNSHMTLVFEDYAPDVSLLFALLNYIRPTGLLIDYIVRTAVNLNTDYVSHDKLSIRTLNTLSSDPIMDEDTAGLVAQISPNNEDNKDVVANVGFTEIFQTGFNKNLDTLEEVKDEA